MRELIKQHIYKSSLDSVAQAYQQRFIEVPNKYFPEIAKIEIFDKKCNIAARKISQAIRGYVEPPIADQIKRLMGMPYFPVISQTTVDYGKMIMVTRVQNESLRSRVLINEKIVYSVHESNPEQTIMNQRSQLKIILRFFAAHAEDLIISTYSKIQARTRLIDEKIIQKMSSFNENTKDSEIKFFDEAVENIKKQDFCYNGFYKTECSDERHNYASSSSKRFDDSSKHHKHRHHRHRHYHQNKHKYSRKFIHFSKSQYKKHEITSPSLENQTLDNAKIGMFGFVEELILKEHSIGWLERHFLKYGTQPILDTFEKQEPLLNIIHVVPNYSSRKRRSQSLNSYSFLNQNDEPMRKKRLISASKFSSMAGLLLSNVNNEDNYHETNSNTSKLEQFRKKLRQDKMLCEEAHSTRDFDNSYIPTFIDGSLDLNSAEASKVNAIEDTLPGCLEKQQEKCEDIADLAQRLNLSSDQNVERSNIDDTTILHSQSSEQKLTIS